jgi:NADP-dependent 3-hydroxy acid dehydrogenase YdfG
MRVVKELLKEGIRITVFSWNNKYLIKFEEGLTEQTFKVSEYDVLEEQDLDKFQEGEFFEKVKKRFEEMQASLQNQLENI